LQYVFLDVLTVSGETVAKLTADEKAWLKAHPKIRLAPDPEFQPIEFFDKSGNYAGIGADYAELISKKLGIKFEIVKCKNWDDVIDRIKRREVDVLNAVVRTPQREKYMLFPAPYLKIPSVIIVRKTVSSNLTLNKLKGMHVVMVSGYGYVDLILNKYPEIKIDLVSDLKTALRKVSFGMADAFVGDLATASFYIELEGITNLKLAGESEPPNISGFAVRSDWSKLSRILEKGVSLLTEEERKNIYNKWIHLESAPGLTKSEVQNLITITLFVIILIVGGFLTWNRMLNKMVRQRTEALQKEIEDRKQAERSIKEAEKKYRHLLENLPQKIFHKDANSIYVSCNENYAKDLNINPEQIVGTTDFNYYSKELAEKYINDDRRIIESGKSEDIVEKYIVGLSEYWVHTIKTPIKDNSGQVTGVLGIFRDITDIKKMEDEKAVLETQLQQAQKMEAIGVLAGGIAHDFNNLLGIILGNTELALDDIPEWNPARHNMEEVLKASFRAKNVIRQLLSFSRKSEIIKKPVAIGPIIKESLNLMRSSLPTTIEIRKNISEDASTVLADPTQIHQIIVNLCTNAAHAMDKNGGILEVSLDNLILDEKSALQYTDINIGHFVCLSVTDTGCGISPELKERIFDPYFTTKDVGKGSGMGLSVVHGIVKNHNGAIFVYSEPEKGSRFKILLPAIEEPEETQQEKILTLPTGSEKILFIDDEQALVDMGKQMLERLGYVVTIQTNPLEALDIFRCQPGIFDLIITDMTMPQMTGDKLTKEVLKIRSDMPIILCTGFSEKINQKNAIEIGIRKYIEKPLNSRELSMAIREVLK